MWMVWHSSVDRWPGAAYFLSCALARLANRPLRHVRRSSTNRVDFLPALLGTERPGDLSRHGPATQSRELGGTFRPRHDDAARMVGDRQSQRARPNPGAEGK